MLLLIERIHRPKAFLLGRALIVGPHVRSPLSMVEVVAIPWTVRILLGIETFFCLLPEILWIPHTVHRLLGLPFGLLRSLLRWSQRGPPCRLCRPGSLGRALDAFSRPLSVGVQAILNDLGGVLGKGGMPSVHHLQKGPRTLHILLRCRVPAGRDMDQPIKLGHLERMCLLLIPQLNPFLGAALSHGHPPGSQAVPLMAAHPLRPAAAPCASSGYTRSVDGRCPTARSTTRPGDVRRAACGSSRIPEAGHMPLVPPRCLPCLPHSTVSYTRGTSLHPPLGAGVGQESLPRHPASATDR